MQWGLVLVALYYWSYCVSIQSEFLSAEVLLYLKEMISIILNWQYEHVILENSTCHGVIYELIQKLIIQEVILNYFIHIIWHIQYWFIHYRYIAPDLTGSTSFHVPHLYLKYMHLASLLNSNLLILMLQIYAISDVSKMHTNLVLCSYRPTWSSQCDSWFSRSRSARCFQGEFLTDIYQGMKARRDLNATE